LQKPERYSRHLDIRSLTRKTENIINPETGTRILIKNKFSGNVLFYMDDDSNISSFLG
jgi:hypothetical protein